MCCELFQNLLGVREFVPFRQGHSQSWGVRPVVGDPPRDVIVGGIPAKSPPIIHLIFYQDNHPVMEDNISIKCVAKQSLSPLVPLEGTNKSVSRKLGKTCLQVICRVIVVAHLVSNSRYKCNADSRSSKMPIIIWHMRARCFEVFLGASETREYFESPQGQVFGGKI